MKKVLLTAILIVLPLFILAQTTTTFTLAGTQTFVTPAGITTLNVQAWGAGGAGGASTNPGFSGARGGSGGGGGAFASADITVTSGATLSVVVGAGGKGAVGATVFPGGFSGITGFPISAEGGRGGLQNTGNSPAGGLGGSVAGSTGTVRTAGSPGESGQSGLTEEDENGQPVIVRAGAGGNAANGGGTGGARLNTPFASSVGNNGNAPGGGGSGGRSSFLFPARKGGDGGDGKVIIGYTCPTYTADSATGSNVNVCSGTSSEITLTGTLPIGLYSVSYEIQGVAQTPAPMQVTTAGTGTFIATGFTTVGTVYVKITALTSGSSAVASENCTSQLPIPLLVPVVVNSSGTAPVATAGTGATCNQITANWQAVAGAVYYEIDVSTVNTFASFVTGYSALNVGNVLTYNITGLANATYYYRVRAYNGNCISANSNTITYATAVIPGTVNSLAGTAGICTEFIARWNTLTGATSYLLDVATTSTFDAGTFVVGFNALDVGNVTTYDVTGLNPNTQYHYRVKAKNGCGQSVNYSVVRSITTTNALPGNVTSNTANSVFCDSFNARWGSSTATTSYLLDVSTSSTFASFLPGFEALDVGNVNGYVVTGLTGGTQYYYRLKAKNGCGVSVNYSGTQAQATSTAAPGTPTVTISSALCNQISIAWTAPNGTLSYTAQISTTNAFPVGPTTQTITGLTTNSYIFTGLTSGLAYYVRVYAKNGCSVGDGTVSSIVTTGTISPAAAPTVTANGSLTICQTDGVTLTSSLVPSASYGYLWSTGATSRAIFVTAPGSYTVQFTRAGGCNSPASAAQVVVVENLPTASAGGSQTICSNQSATVSGASAANGSIQWTFSGGAGTLTNSTTLTPTYTPTLGGAARTVVLTMTVTSTNSCMPQIATAKYTINIQGAPTVSISGAKSTCPGGAITVLAGEANSSNGTVSWAHDGSGTLTNGTTLTPTYTSVAADAGKQVTLTMTVTASPACSTAYVVSDVYPVVVFANNTVGAASSSPVVCIDTPITDVTHVTDGALGIGTPVNLPAGVTANWATNTITISGTPTEAGTFNYSIPLTGGCGTLNATGTITVNALTVSPTIGTVELPTCVNSQGRIELTGLPSGTWSIAQSGTVSQTYSSSGSNYTISGLIPGNYSFTVQVGTNCPSLPTLNVIIDAPVTNVWDGAVWSTGSPPIDTDAIEFNGDFVSTSDLEGCSCKVNDGRNVTINSGNTLKIKHGLTVNSGAGAILTFENNASLVQEDDNAVNTGNINYKRTTTPVRRYDFTHWGCPVTRIPAFTLHDLSPNTLGDKYYKYDPNNGWVIIYNGTDAWIKGVGYIIRSPQNYDIDVPAVFNGTFNGVPNNGLVTVPISTAAKYYLIGNPYPSAVYADQFIVDNQTVMYGTLYYWTHNSAPRKMAPGDTTYKYTADDYAIYNLSGSVLAGTLTGEGAETPGNTYAPIGYIASGQSVFVESKIAGDAFFNNGMRVVGHNDHFFKQDPKFKKLAEREKHRIWLNLRNTEGAFKQLLVAYVEGATNSWDDNFDTKTMDSNKYIDFYSNNESLNYSIQGKALPFNETELIPLGYKSTIAGEFSISIDHVDGLFNTQNIYLEDKKNNVVHNLRESNYKFSTETGTFNDRFVLRYTGKTLGTDDVTNLLNYILCTVKDKIVRVKSSKETLKDVYIFDVSGKMLYKKNKIGETELQISNLQSANQVLMIRVVLDNGSSQTQKVIF